MLSIDLCCQQTPREEGSQLTVVAPHGERLFPMPGGTHQYHLHCERKDEASEKTEEPQLRCNVHQFRGARQDRVPNASLAELGPVAPCGQLTRHRLSNAHEIEPTVHSREADVVARDANPRTSVESLGSFDCFPPLFKRREVPALAMPAHHPQATFSRIERQTSTDRERLNPVVGAKVP